MLPTVEPRNRPTSVLGSILRCCVLGWRAHARLPKTREPATLGRRPVNVSKDVTSSPAFGNRLRTWTTAARASADSYAAAPASCSAARTRSISVRLTRFALPFCCDLYGAVGSGVMPLSSCYVLKFVVRYSFAPSWRTRLTVAPLSVSGFLMRAFSTSGAMPFVCMGVAMMNPLFSSNVVMK